MFGCACTALALVALGCGASSRASEAALAPAASAGDEPPPSAAAAPPAEEEKPARGRIVVQATCAGKPVIAHGHMPIERGLVVDFEMGQEFTAEAGARQVTIELGQADVLVDQPTLQLEIPVEPRKLTQFNAVFPWARVQLNLLIHGNAQPPTNIKLIRKGEVVAEVKSGGPAFLVSPGNYEADVPVRGKTARVKGLVFFEGTEQIVPVRVP
ncbi:MAG TPA: hypothetical protein VFN67_24945 [Polyangiales bacterium]|nr:hypothetical protein [Polyangiales bacterium]